jgi:hypothetical protein
MCYLSITQALQVLAHYRQPINVLTAETLAFLMDYT